ncbi:potential ER/nuclear membrane ubiquitin-protein ligase [Pseudozyma hubeiensis SY62]|uniref:RING-type E3 ubiquitin transferase n=1 Tax=Pseudozyma hubeiensis (strain SY62) TaxID=1305764 RepID=R9P9U1_PSEHS|nr:potential ER/nuclear membrane ubiquitin-protein ligase [Pseudozyma hubeiensis SY62]GAC94820.1 potential ER/nuclear membrane ubiquitin-protein ligase [Pseudozyma hubeiensis SY62]
MEDEDTCRICRSGPEPSSPLYHPCKCTGSIRYCHQDCLLEWLQHSRKKYCELCNHAFIFHKKYRKDMPSDGKLPRYLYARRLVIRSIQTVKLAARALLVGFTWLALLPYININVWRFWFWCIDYAILYWFVDVATRLGMAGLIPTYQEAAPPANATAVKDLDGMVKFSSSDAWSRIASPFASSTSSHTPITISGVKLSVRTLLEHLAHDVFQGQILSCVIVVFFVGVFLLREWILQNMPQNFDVQPQNVDAVQPEEGPRNLADGQPRAAEERQAQIRAQFEQRRDEFERVLADLQETPQDEANEEVGGERELELDPEEQRVQARLARLRRLEQVMAARERPAGDAAADTAEGSSDSAGSSEPPQLAASNGTDPSTSTQNLRDALGWSEAGPSSEGLKETNSIALESLTQQDPQAGTSKDILEQSDDDRKADEAAVGLQLEAQPEELQEAAQNDVSVSRTGDYTEPAQADSPRDVTTRTVSTGDDHTASPAAEPLQPLPQADELPLAAADEARDDDEAWEDESDADADAPAQPDPADEVALRAAAAAAFPPPIAHPIAAEDEIEIVAAAAEAADDPEAEIGLAEEMDGILEAVGMRGPIFGIVQNLFLMIFLSFFVMQAFVMVPYVVGRLLGSGPGLIKVLALPVRLLRYVTDPVFDGLIAVGAKGWPRVVAAMGLGQAKTDSTVVDAAKNGKLINAWLGFFTSAVGHAKSDATKVVRGQALDTQAVAAKSSALAGLLVRVLPASVTASSQWTAVSNAFDIALATGFRGTLERLADTVSDLFAKLDSHRIVTSTTDRVVCIAFGHAYWMLILFIHQHFSKPDFPRAVAEQSALKMFMDQHVLILKAISFIFIELFVFPLGCGLLFDICTMPIFAGASIALWPAKIKAAPISFAFTRWMGGTVYMFVFAQYVSATRKVLRPGVLCWIRDPNDPSFHPIREILDKKTWTQLKKIGASAMMYAAVLVASVGVNTYFLRYAMGWSGVLPLRWKPFDPWTEVPVDLLLVHFAVPWATQKVDPEKLAEKWLKWWWKGASKMLRLSTYMIGGRFMEERRGRKGNMVVNVWKALTGQQGGEEEYVEDGTLGRVPADDKAITSGPLIIPLKSDGTPATERMAEALVKQEADAEKHTPKPTYEVLYLPPSHQVRITTILTLLWLSHCALFILGLSLPLLLGRGFAYLLKGRQVHDFYSFSIGLTLLVLAAKLYKGSKKTWNRRIKRARYIRTTPRLYITVRIVVEIKRIFKSIFLLAGVAGIVPLVTGLLVDQYVLVPLRYRSTQVPVLHLGQIWALGVIETRLLLFTARFIGVPTTGLYSTFMSNIDEVVRGGVYPRPKVKLAWKRVVVPVVVAGFVLLSVPFTVAEALATSGWAEASSKEQEQLLLRKVFGAIQSIVLVATVRAVVRKRMDSWTELLKDEVFLESTELKNFEADEAKAGEGMRGSSSGKVKMGDEEAEWIEEEEGEVDGDGEGRRADEYVAEGTLPDVLFR